MKECKKEHHQVTGVSRWPPQRLAQPEVEEFGRTFQEGLFRAPHHECIDKALGIR